MQGSLTVTAQVFSSSWLWGTSESGPAVLEREREYKANEIADYHCGLGSAVSVPVRCEFRIDTTTRLVLLNWESRSIS